MTKVGSTAQSFRGEGKREGGGQGEGGGGRGRAGGGEREGGGSEHYKDRSKWRG